MVIDSVDEGFFPGDITFSDPQRTSSQWRGRNVEQISAYSSMINDMECGNTIAFATNFDFSVPPFPSSIRPLSASLPPIPPLPPTSLPNFKPVLFPVNMTPPPIAQPLLSIPRLPQALPTPPPLKIPSPANVNLVLPPAPFLDKSPASPSAYVPPPLPTVQGSPVALSIPPMKLDPVPSFTVPSYAYVEPLASVKLPQIEVALQGVSKSVESPKPMAVLPLVPQVEKTTLTLPMHQTVSPIPKAAPNGALPIAAIQRNTGELKVPVIVENKPTSILQDIKQGASQLTGGLLHEVWDIVGGLGTEVVRGMDLVSTKVLNTPTNFEQNAHIANQNMHAKIEEVFGVPSAVHLPGVTMLQAPAPGGASTLVGRVTQVVALEGSAARVSSIGRAAVVEEVATASLQTIPEKIASVEARASGTTQAPIIKNDPIVTVAVKESTSVTKDKVGFFENNLKHIFRNDSGHLPDTPANRQLLVDTASNQKNYLGKDRFGNEWYAKTLDNGSQAWVELRNGQIRNAGLNEIPDAFEGLNK